MKHLLIPLFIILFSCSNVSQTNIADEEDFITAAKSFHNLYINAGDCAERNSMMDKDIVFYENGEQFTYQNILDYCTYIKPKKPYETFSKQYMIQSGVGFDYVDQYYVNPEQDTLREVSSRIWEKKSNGWMVTYMQVSRQVAHAN